MLVDKGTDAADAGPGVDASSHAALSREEFISETLDWCAELFRSQRARFVRPTESGGWIVYTRQNNVLSTHEADYAEAAMARAVGLGRHPLVVTRPRVTRPGTTDLRPISVSSYLGIPLISQDRLVGVIECAGEARPDIEAALQVALPRLELAGARLLHDPALRERPAISLDSRCVLCGAVWSTGSIQLSTEEFAFLSAIVGPTPVADAASAASLDNEAALAIAQSLLSRGLIETTMDRP